MRTFIKIYFLATCFFASMPVHSQSPAFYHLSTAEGLSDNSVAAVARDMNGILWIGTTEGLNSFDGNQITVYHNYKYPLLAGNGIEGIMVDPENRIWLRTNTNKLNMLDAKRNFHLFTVGDTADRSRVSNMLFVKSKGMIAFKGRRHFTWKNKASNTLEQIAIPGEDMLPAEVTLVNKLNSDTLFFYGQNKLVVYDYSAMKVLMSLPLLNIEGIARINDDELIAYRQDGKVFYRISIKQQKIIQEYHDLVDQYNKPLTGSLRNCTTIDENTIAITSRFGGLYFVDINKQTVLHCEHDPLDPKSLGGNNTYRINYDAASGYLFITTLTSGLHYYNTRITQAAYKPYFIDAGSDVFDGFIQSVAVANNGIVWMGAQDRLISWDRKKNRSVYVPCYLPGGTNLNKIETIRALCFDEKENLWVGTTTKGVLILDKQFKTIKQLTDSAAGNINTIPSRWINDISTDRKGNLWVGTIKGTCMVEKDNFKVHDFTNHPLLSTISNIPCASLWVDDKGRVWIGTTKGAWCYDEVKNTMTQYSKENGPAHNTVLAINQDNIGNYYFATPEGFSVLSKDGTIKSYNRSNGLRNDRCEGILKDDKGFLWIGNLNCILRYDPENKKFAVYEEGYGFSHAGFRMRCCFKSNTGEMFWGTDRGLTYFFPEQMNTVSTSLYPSINTLQTSDSVFRFTANETLQFPYNTSSFLFQFSSGELTGGKKSQLLYRLTGFDKDWLTPAANGQVAYSKLPPGEYRFDIKASRDGNTWYDAAYPVTIIINKAWWQQLWFRLLIIAITAGIVYVVYQYYMKRKRMQEMQRMIDYFANSGYEHNSVEEILWDICRNCISRLGFEDCVIYLKDEERKVLIQKAAYGPKISKPNEILNPIEIPLGKGIVGDVALTGKACIVNDTSKDSRYIIDDERRLSEITVPIIHEEQVIGVIDSENRKRNYFTKQHLKTLQTITSLSSAKISRAIALDAMNKSKLEVMALNVKMAESKFLNLRLQMNPHFLFNSLSSIQHLIVSKQTTEAYKYLTIFSNFLRSLLKYAEKNFIPLDEELKILKMYVELESLRFDQSFVYEITVDESLTNDEVLVPSLMVQPFAENAIWHGLLHKEGEKKLSIRFSNNNDDYLTCIIEDNGAGRKEAASIKKNKISSMTHESKGISIIEERLYLLQQKTGKPANVAIEDLYAGDGKAAGTKVIITIPYYNPEEI